MYTLRWFLYWDSYTYFIIWKNIIWIFVKPPVPVVIHTQTCVIVVITVKSFQNMTIGLVIRIKDVFFFNNTILCSIFLMDGYSFIYSVRPKV